MGLFGNLFGKPDHTEAILTAGLALADEMERVYRNQLESISPTGVGLYKARLLSATFSLAAYKLGGCAKSKDDLLRFINQCSGIALTPLIAPGANPQFSKELAVFFTADFMSDVFKLIQSELTDGPSTLNQQTKAFSELKQIYHGCLVASIGEEQYRNQRQRRDLEVESIIWSHLRHLENVLGQIT